MRRLFIALLPLLFVGCDSSNERDLIVPYYLVGEWVLESATDADGDPVPAPIGSTLLFEADGELRIDSGNDCAGGSFGVGTEAIVDPPLELEIGGCTFVGFPPEDDLSQFLLAISDLEGDVQHVHGRLYFPFGVRESIPMQLVLDAPQREVRLVFLQVR